MTHRLLLCFVLAIIPLISSAQERVTVTDPEIKFSYILPDGWEVKDDGYDYLIQSPDVENTYVSMTYVEDAQGSGYLESLGSKPTFEDNFDFEIRYMLPEVFVNINVVEQGTTEIDGASARWVRFRSGANEELISIFYMYQKLNQTFKITGTAPTEHFEKIQPYFTSIIESFNSSEL